MRVHAPQNCWPSYPFSRPACHTDCGQLLITLSVRAGDTQALPGYVSFYLQLQDPNSAGSNKWDCFASYKLAIVNHLSRDLDLSRESWHRFSSRPARQQTRPLSSSSHGWADFASSTQVREFCFLRRCMPHAIPPSMHTRSWIFSAHDYSAVVWCESAELAMAKDCPFTSIVSLWHDGKLTHEFCFSMPVQIQDAKSGFLVNGFMTVSATVLVLEESVQFTRDADGASASEGLRCGTCIVPVNKASPYVSQARIGFAHGATITGTKEMQKSGLQHPALTCRMSVSSCYHNSSICRSSAIICGPGSASALNCYLYLQWEVHVEGAQLRPVPGDDPPAEDHVAALSSR